MWIEQQKLHFNQVQIRQKSDNYQISCGKASLELNSRQYQYFDQLFHGLSVQKLVQTSIQKGWLVSFREIFKMLEQFVELNFIVNPEIHSYFKMLEGSVKASGMQDFVAKSSDEPEDPKLLLKLPFFRTLPAPVQKVFLQNTSIMNVAKDMRICKMGTPTRELYAILEGAAGVYKIFPDGRRKLLTTVAEGSSFGEGGFLLGKPRGADVITLTKCKLAQVSYSPEFQKLIDTGKAEGLQRRFWVLNGLLSSEVFSQIPPETFDSLVFAGTMRELKENTVLIREGEPGQSFFIVVQGSLSISQKTKALNVVGQGGILGEVALLVSSGVRTATAIAQRETVVLEIGMAEFYETLATNLFLAKTIEEVAWQRWHNKAG